MESLLKFREFFNEINLQNGRNYKISILEKYKEDEDIKYYLEFIFNPYKVTGISLKKLSKNFDTVYFSYSMLGQEVDRFNSVKELLEYILINNTGTDRVLKSIKLFIREHFSTVAFEGALENLLENIIAKNIILGVDIKSINKVMNNLVPTFKVQLAEKYFSNPKLVEGKDFTITTKLDGTRIIALKRDGVVKFYTRQGREYEGLVDLKAELESFDVDNICFDGELIVDREEGKESKDQFAATQSKVQTKSDEKHGLRMRIFDTMPSEMFLKSECNIIYQERRNTLEGLFDSELRSSEYFVKVPVLYSGNDTSKIIELLDSELAHGEEGVMININDAPYIFDRCKTLLKVKKMNDLDLEIVGFESGTVRSKYENTLGSILVEYKGNIVGCSIGAGPGSDKLRDEIWNNQDEWLGRTAIIQYFEETVDKNGKFSLRFPVYRGWRDDK